MATGFSFSRITLKVPSTDFPFSCLVKSSFRVLFSSSSVLLARSSTFVLMLGISTGRNFFLLVITFVCFFAIFSLLRKTSPLKTHKFY